MTLPITVVIPCYNMANTLARAVESALDAGADHVVIVDDCSTDNTLQVVERLSDLYVQVRPRRLDMHSGVVVSRNYGVRDSFVSELIVPLDADDQLTPNGLQALYDAYEPDRWVYGDWIEDGETIIAAPPGMLDRKNVAHATMLFHRGDWWRAGGYDPDFNIGGEDWAFQLALTRAGVTPVKVNEPIYIRDTSINERTRLARDRIPMINQLVKEKYGG